MNTLNGKTVDNQKMTYIQFASLSNIVLNVHPMRGLNV